MFEWRFEGARARPTASENGGGFFEIVFYKHVAPTELPISKLNHE
jgi:hypothetical protein